MPLHVTAADLIRITASAYEAETYSAAAGNRCLVVDLRRYNKPLPEPRYRPACVVIGLGRDDPATDVTALTDTELDTLLETVAAQPVAAATLTQLLHHNAVTDVTQGLFAESLAYSTLQQSDGFRTWLAGNRRPDPKPDPEPSLLIERTTTVWGDELHLTLNRPHVHNAYSTNLRDALCEALQLAHADDHIHSVSLAGNGPSFSAGGDLSEFGAVSDAGVAHVSRTSRSAAALLASLPCASRARVHGACVGAGIELPAFVQQITAHTDSFFQLPEVRLGLVPGAGGTVSICRRIGRHRTAWMALSGARVDPATALAWGLVDDVSVN